MNSTVKLVMIGVAAGAFVIWLRNAKRAKYVPDGVDRSNPYWETNTGSWYDSEGNYRGITGPR